MLDWQCVQVANLMQDPANLIVSGLCVADRRQCERDLLAHYVGKLRVMCLVEMQPEDVCAAISERACAAAVDHRTIDILPG